MTVMRRLLVAVAVATSIAAILWYGVVPHWRPPLRAGERYGIDVSHHQGPIDWPAVAADGIDFAYIKASEGGDFTDTRFDHNWLASAAAGIDRGAYHFFTLCTPGVAQARHFLKVAPPEASALPPAVDLEFGGNCSGRPPVEDLHREVDDFVRIVEAAWQKEVVVYALATFDKRYGIFDHLDRPAWKLGLFRRPRGEWMVWQLHGFASVDGIEGRVDFDIMAAPAAAAEES